MVIKQATALRVTDTSHGVLHSEQKQSAPDGSAQSGRLHGGDQVRVQEHANFAA
jgi:hypothetical protein